MDQNKRELQCLLNDTIDWLMLRGTISRQQMKIWRNELDLSELTDGQFEEYLQGVEKIIESKEIGERT
ncbi:hypothetical protein IBX65_08930 [Candidatus Aerophobetes bacterium]|nr:hypothetical protein [Candidatus Aerophobetes bacterium]